jgi:ankyrin repeat protein
MKKALIILFIIFFNSLKADLHCDKSELIRTTRQRYLDKLFSYFRQKHQSRLQLDKITLSPEDEKFIEELFQQKIEIYNTFLFKHNGLYTLGIKKLSNTSCEPDLLIQELDTLANSDPEYRRLKKRLSAEMNTELTLVEDHIQQIYSNYAYNKLILKTILHAGGLAAGLITVLISFALSRHKLLKLQQPEDPISTSDNQSTPTEEEASTSTTSNSSSTSTSSSSSSTGSSPSNSFSDHLLKLLNNDDWQAATTFMMNANHQNPQDGLVYFLSLDRDGKTPFSIAAENNQTELVKIMIDRKDATIKLINEHLYVAVQQTNHDSLKNLILTHLVKQDTSQPIKKGPLQSTAPTPTATITTPQPQNHPDSHSPVSPTSQPGLQEDNRGKLARFLSYIENNQYQAISDFLEKDTAMLEVLKKTRFDPSNKDILLAATEQNDTPLANICILNGWNTNSIDTYGMTPLHYAMTNGNMEITQLLLQMNCTLDTPNKNNQTPLDLAEENLRNCNNPTQHDIYQKIIDLYQAQMKKVKATPQAPSGAAISSPHHQQQGSPPNQPIPLLHKAMNTVVAIGNTFSRILSTS